MIFPIVTLIGRKNVGKSTLFNRLTCTNNALIGSDDLGVTRDRRYGSFIWKDYQSIVIDTGGVDTVKYGIDVFIFDQSISAILESDLILCIVDGSAGLMPGDRDIVHYLYKFRKSVFIVVNKIDICNLGDSKFEFYSLGIKKVIFVSAAHGHGIDCLSEEIFLEFLRKKLLLKNRILNKDMQLKMFLKNPSYFLGDNRSDIIRLAVVGAPNVGKSTFINYILGENRVVVSQVPGTTRDSVCVPMIYHGCKWIITDTAGLRKKNKISSTVEEMSIIHTMKAIQNVTVVLLLINAYYGISNYDLSLLNNILRSGKSLVIGVNKWDLLSNDLQKEFKIMCNARMHFIPFIVKNFISSLSGDGVYRLLESVMEAHGSSFKSISTSSLTSIMRLAVDQHPPPRRVYNKQIKLKYAHIGSRLPFMVVIHGTNVKKLPDCYKRYLIKCFSNSLKLSGLSIYIRFKEERK